MHRTPHASEIVPFDELSRARSDSCRAPTGSDQRNEDMYEENICSLPSFTTCDMCPSGIVLLFAVLFVYV